MKTKTDTISVKTDTVSASSLETGTLDNKVAQRIKVYEFDNELGCYTEKLANLTEGQSYMAVEFEKMQKDMKELQESMLYVQSNWKFTKTEFSWFFANRLNMIDESIEKAKLILIVWFIFTVVITVLGAIYHK